MEPILQVEHLTKVFPSDDRPDYKAVDDASFSLAQGEKLAIIGESGSGKTTVANLITRLLDATSGRIFLAGEDITWATGRRLRLVYQQLQMVFQNPIESFDPRCTLGEGIMESLVNHGWKVGAAREEAMNLLEACGLPRAFADRYPHEVSGGQCQRAAIARAIAIRPSLLILDEATSALDVTVQADILRLLTKLHTERGMSYLFICHDIALVQNFCDRVLVMHRGQIIEQGSPDEVIRHPQKAYTQKLIDSVL